MDPDDTQYPAASQQCKDIREQMRDMALMILSSMNGIAAAWVTSMGFAQAKALMDSRYKVEGLTYNIVSALSTPAPEAALLVTPAAVPPFFSLPGTKSHALSSATDSSSTPPLVVDNASLSPSSTSHPPPPPPGAFPADDKTTPLEQAADELNAADDVVLARLSEVNDLEDLKIHYWRRSKGKYLGRGLAKAFPNLKSLELNGHSWDWVLAILITMSQTVHRLALYISQLDVAISTALLTRKEILTDLIVDFGATIAGERTLQHFLLVFLECTGLRALEYHAYTEEAKFGKALLKTPWNLPRLTNLRFFGLIRASFLSEAMMAAALPDWQFKQVQQMHGCCVQVDSQVQLGAVDMKLMLHVHDFPALKVVTVDCTDYTCA
ncbi:hypothetical protein BGX33_009781 [Mortierella sp. NVP41]|nr:hypothetical protein BGX33_009781 [Mortierella sp. NVP41]